jgi:hypothetical protein
MLKSWNRWGVIGLDDNPIVSSNIGLGLCIKFGEDWEERFDVPSTIV